MEYMRIEGFIGKAVSKLINKAVEQKVGFRPGIALESLNFSTTEDEQVEVKLTATMSKMAFERMIEEVTK